MGIESVYYWYSANVGVPANDWMYIKCREYYGYNNAQPIELIKKHDMKLVCVGTWADVAGGKKLEEHFRVK